MHVLAVEHQQGRLVVTVETDATVAGCPSCGVIAVGHGRRVHEVADAPCFDLPVRVRWRKRIWRCADADCPTGTFSERHELIARRAKLTARAVGWATDALEHEVLRVPHEGMISGANGMTDYEARTVAVRENMDPAA